ncbi:hypothetical protein EIN_150060 [Entamoeba invadens IP1]|uniref:PARP catalytic domain-containing protein n=1 Tax=Entamoeba invadens IP1 TaxID=370355 RepID=A0A0A1U8E0_ENTIV|nr:hypothetical protein EIN_150060 [Entamoeba invadens IP1]ELP91179.1 hypothetical protein EIN_150060 [Entamoeba invadens IP1]|eukprot:XP_004257950.1 hypothetical protein EIN_150060 [Entamoeba invadens IP1]
MSSIEDEFTSYCEQDGSFCMLDHSTSKHVFQILYIPDDKEFYFQYANGTPSQYDVKISGKKYEHVVNRSKTTWSLIPPKSLTDALTQLSQFLKDEKEHQFALENDPALKRKNLSDRLDAKRKIALETQKQVFAFDTEIAYQNLKEDIIQSFFNEEKFGFIIKAVDDNPYHWVVSYKHFAPNSPIFSDLDKMMSLSARDSIELDLEFSSTMFPVIPPKYNFLSPKLRFDTLKMIFKSGAFEKDVYNPLTKIEFLINIKNVIEKFARIDFGKNNKTISDYRDEKNLYEQQLAKPLLGQLIQLGKDFIEKTPEAHGQNYTNMGFKLQKSNSIQFNNFLLENSMSYIRFIKCVEKFGMESIETSGFFCWHGSNDNCIQSICKNGFDPHKRAGQAYGPGEYFARDPGTSMGYSKGNNHLILTYVLRPKNKGLLVDRDRIYVVNNPIDWSYSYCLPVLVITFGNGTPVNFLDKAIN